MNEDEVCDLLLSRGWQVVPPETLSVKQQMGLFQQARAVCGVHGSALTNLLWMTPKARVLECCPDNFLLGSFEWLARCIGLEHDFMVLPGDAAFRGKVPLDDALKRKLDWLEGA